MYLGHMHNFMRFWSFIAFIPFLFSSLLIFSSRILSPLHKYCHGHGSPRKGVSPTANTRDTRDRMIVNDANTRLIPEDMEPHDRMSQMVGAGGRDP